MRLFLCLGLTSLLAIRLTASVSVSASRTAPEGAFDPNESAALFVGVRDFPYDKTTLNEVPYAVDDAVDLAHLVAIGSRVPLVQPRRIVLALSGEPQKEPSRERLRELLLAGAVRTPATQSDVLNQLDTQSRLAGPKGILIVSFATHGINVEGSQHLLTGSSILRHRETTITEEKVRDIVAESRAARSLVLIDACREKLTTGSRNGEPDPRSVAAILRTAMADVHGTAVLSAAAPRAYAYDDPVRQNGVFTAAVIDGLRCEAPRDEKSFVTLDRLHIFVEERVLEWVRKHRDPGALRATQKVCEGRRTCEMPLSACDTPRRALKDTARPSAPRRR